MDFHFLRYPGTYRIWSQWFKEMARGLPTNCGPSVKSFYNLLWPYLAYNGAGFSLVCLWAVIFQKSKTNRISKERIKALVESFTCPQHRHRCPSGKDPQPSPSFIIRTLPQSPCKLDSYDNTNNHMEVRATGFRLHQEGLLIYSSTLCMRSFLCVFFK